MNIEFINLSSIDIKLYSVFIRCIIGSPRAVDDLILRDKGESFYVGDDQCSSINNTLCLVATTNRRSTTSTPALYGELELDCLTNNFLFTKCALEIG